MSSFIKHVNVEEIRVLKQIADKYALGLRTSSRQVLGEIFHKDAIIYGEFVGARTDGPIENLYQAIEARGPTNNMTHEVDVVSLTPSSAVLRVHLANHAGDLAFEDNLSLIKKNGDWKIVCKIFEGFSTK